MQQLTAAAAYWDTSSHDAKIHNHCSFGPACAGSVVNGNIYPELPLYAGIDLADVILVDAAAADAALAALMATDAIGFDTESKPTFAKGEVSTGPHLIQLATDAKAYLFPVTGTPAVAVLRTILEAPQVLKVGFGLRDDLHRLQSKLGIGCASVLDLAIALRREKRGDVGAKTAVAQFFGQRMQKSKKTSTTNWSNPCLTERQMLYAANDAHVALRVYRAWRQAGGGAPASDFASGPQRVHPDE